MTLRCALPVLLVFIAACHESSEPAPAASAEVKAAAPTANACASASSGAAFAQVTLDEIDQRAPVPLVPMMANHQKQNMRDHLLAVQEIVAALATDDFAAIEKAAGRIGYSEQMGMMCHAHGRRRARLHRAALTFHHTADSIADAAKKQDAGGVTKALASTLETCTSCHRKYKQQVVDDATWASLTKQAAPTP